MQNGVKTFRQTNMKYCVIKVPKGHTQANMISFLKMAYMYVQLAETHYLNRIQSLIRTADGRRLIRQ